ncbi:MAG: hypothetical protein ACLTDX_11430 [[Clostridium] innocuum]
MEADGSFSPAPAPVPAVYSYVTLDINPSMEWKLDEQQRVVRVTAYNKDADNILTELQLEGKQLDAALRMLLDNEQFSAYMKSGFLEVSVYSENSSVFFCSGTADQSAAEGSDAAKSVSLFPSG